jgi:hypothetical protein
MSYAVQFPFLPAMGISLPFAFGFLYRLPPCSTFSAICLGLDEIPWQFSELRPLILPRSPSTLSLRLQCREEQDTQFDVASALVSMVAPFWRDFCCEVLYRVSHRDYRPILIKQNSGLASSVHSLSVRLWIVSVRDYGKSAPMASIRRETGSFTVTVGSFGSSPSLRTRRCLRHAFGSSM